MSQAEGEMNEARTLLREAVVDLLGINAPASIIKKINRVEHLLRLEDERPTIPPWLRNPNPGGTE